MKLKNYIPTYGEYKIFDLTLDFCEDVDHELSTEQLAALCKADFELFLHQLAGLQSEDMVVNYLAALLTEYEKRGGDALTWISDVLFDVDTFQPVHDTLITETLEDWQKKRVAAKNMSMKQIALIHFYNKEPISKLNGDGVAAFHGYSSGHKLYQLYNWFNSQTNRVKPHEESRTVTNNKITLIESIIPLLNGKNQQHAVDDLAKLKRLESDYIDTLINKV